MFLLAEDGKKILPLMEKSIAAEKSEQFTVGLMEIVDIVAVKHGLAGHPTLPETMRARVERFQDPTAKWYGTEMLARIARHDSKPR